MRRRFFATRCDGQHGWIEGEGARHLIQVLRAEPGTIYEIAHSGSVYLARIDQIEPQTVRFAILERLPAAAPHSRVELAAAIFKFDRFEWIVEKATELGVDRLVPVISQRTARPLAAAAVKRVERWRRIAVEASQQSRRAEAPEIAAPQKFDAVLQPPGELASGVAAASFRIFLCEDQGVQPLASLLLSAAEPLAAPLRCLVGPEGGWSEAEKFAAERAGWVAVSLGSRILRAETAALAALVLLQNWPQRA